MYQYIEAVGGLQHSRPPYLPTATSSPTIWHVSSRPQLLSLAKVITNIHVNGMAEVEGNIYGSMLENKA